METWIILLENWKKNLRGNQFVAARTSSLCCAWQGRLGDVGPKGVQGPLVSLSLPSVTFHQSYCFTVLHFFHSTAIHCEICLLLKLSWTNPRVHQVYKVNQESLEDQDPRGAKEHWDLRENLVLQESQWVGTNIPRCLGNVSWLPVYL